jgi:TonB family protein
MRTLTRFTLAAISLLVCARAGAAQAGAEGWVEFAPAGEGFAVLMPKQPASEPSQARAGGLSVAGRRYVAAGDDGSSYIVWSLKDTSGLGAHLGAQEYANGQPRSAVSPYLDALAEVAWQLLIAPEVERLKKNPEAAREAYLGMSYSHEFDLDGHPAREYAVGLKSERGPVYVCADAQHIYVVAALGADAQSPQLRQFVNSFGFGAVRRPKPSQSSGDVRGGGIGTGTGGGIGPGRGYNTGGGDVRGNNAGDAPVDYNRPFLQREVTRKAIITYKPEPGFTEEARKFSVTGVVRLRAILAATGEVTGMVVVKGLPHGLTERAIAAARQVRFTPAEKDGHAVSQYIVFEYNFNIY